MPDASTISSIAVVGNDPVAWASAITLARELGRYDVTITVVAQASSNPSALIEVSRPALRELIDLWGLDERQLASSASGLLSLGTDCCVPERPRFFLPFGEHGISAAPASFEQSFMKAYPSEDLAAFNQHFLATQAASLNRFDFPSHDPRSVKCTLRYGFHLDMAQFETYLKSQAQNLGVRAVNSNVAEVVLEPQTGHIDWLRLSDGTRFQADFYLDCSGVAGELTEKALAVPYQSWTKWFPYDRQLSACVSDLTQAKPYSQLRAEPRGWCRTAGLQGRRAEEFFYQHGFEGESSTYNRLSAIESASRRHLKPGRRERFWAANCLALGDAAGSATPLVLSELHWACTALFLWLELYPNGHNMEAQRREYNRRCAEVLEGMRDYHLALLSFGPHKPEGGLEDLSESLQWKFALFADQGRLWMNDEEPVSRDHWMALLLGAGMIPARHDIVLESVSNEELLDNHRKIHKKLVETAEQMPLLDDVIERYCPARNTKL